MSFKRLVLVVCMLFLVFACQTSRVTNESLQKENELLKSRIGELEHIDNSSNRAVIELHKMKVVYRGIVNPLTINVEGAKSFEASAPGLKKVDDKGNYILSPGSGITVDITIKAELINGEDFTEIKTFRIMDISAPFGVVNGFGGQNCFVMLKKEALKGGEVGVKFKDFVFDLNLVVESFKIKFPEYATIPLEGKEIPSSLDDMIDALNVGDLVQIFDIDLFLKDPRGFKLKRVSPISIQIVE